MRRLTALLRDADPIVREPAPGVQEWHAVRQAVLHAPRGGAGAPSSRRTTILSLTAVAVLAAGVLFQWSRATPDVIAAVRFEIRLAETVASPGLREAAIAGTNDKIYLQEPVVVTNSDISRAEALANADGRTFGVAVTFTPEGSVKMRRATEAHVGRPLAILIDGEVVAAPTVRSAISSSGVISGSYSRVEADRIVAGIIGR
jgi:hypothetical protein